MKDAALNHEKAKKFLKQSLSKVRQREALVQNLHQAQVDKKVQNIISLKNNISANRENLRALQARDAAFGKKRENAEELERRKVLEEGGNPELDIQREVASVESVSAVNFSNVMSQPKLDETSSRISKIEDDVNLAQPEFPGLYTIHYHIGQFSYDWKNICRFNRKTKGQIYIEICAKVMGQPAGNVINMMFFLKKDFFGYNCCLHVLFILYCRQFSYDWKNICRFNRKTKGQIYIEICAKVMGQPAGNVINMMFFLKY
ncbi:unnamed protein product [Clavelina lepadiformis]|uniref:Uncharacterized protein n=1 Tax=Clavelina lepadiformis TaxID=159417 RepID=A0ABP0FVF2_CLALP